MSRTKQAARRAKAKRTDDGDAASNPERGPKKAKVVPSTTDQSESNGSATAAADVITRLLGGMALDEFQREYFEKKPLLVRKCGNQELFPKGLFSREALLRATAANELEHGKDMTVCRYVNGERDNYVPLNGKLDATKKNVGSLLDKGYSCQFYQPQRYVDGLFAINAAFEDTFGGLAGASAYLTPPKAQALAPHNDDVEVFILQTEGRKKWKLYKPLVELAGEHSSDLSPDVIGEVWQEFTLEQGDMLYFPRGVIHQACTDDKQFSTHVTVSVYQHNSWANFLEVALPRIIRRAFDSDVAFRRGLPVGYLKYLGSQFPVDSADAKSFAAECKMLVEKLGRWVEPSDLQQSADEAALDYIANRLPPVATPAPSTAEFILEADAKVRFRDRSHVRLVVGEDPDMKETMVTLYHSVRNCRVHHMGVCSCLLEDEGDDENGDDEDDEGGSEAGGSDGGDENGDSGEEDDDDDQGSEMDMDGMAGLGGPAQPQCLGFPGSLMQPLMKLYAAYPSDVTVQELVDVAQDETEVRGMLLRLWSEGLLHA